MKSFHGSIKIGRVTTNETVVAEGFEREFNSIAEMHKAFVDAGLSSRVALVGCGSQKGTKAAKAKDLYRSNLFHAARAYAERTCARWFILSAKFGLLDPERVIEPYEQRLQRANSKGWGERVGRQLLDVVDHDTPIVCLAGGLYSDAIDIGHNDLYWEEPLKGMGIGQRIAWLKENTPR